MNKDNLLKLADFLCTVPPGKFSYNHWAGSTDLGSCGTTACALGWATQIPEFGLCLRRATCGGQPISVVTVCLTDEEQPQNWESAVRAGKQVFDLTEAEFEWLFTPSDDDSEEYCDDEEWGEDGKPLSRASARTVAEHIRGFVEAGGIPE